ncbi:MAG: spore cortex biosynthesis protein YabQ [Firmicutes bacterium]|nr:spore cortex biosynthesis protein YabQ [Bacillota bacterium]
MKISYILQLKDFSIMFGVGIILGVFYGVINIPNFIKEHVVIRIICDIIFTSIMTFAFVFIVESINFGSIRAYLLVGYILGFTIERITLGKIFAKGYKRVYNLCVNGLKKFYTSKLGRIVFK